MGDSPQAGPPQPPESPSPTLRPTRRPVVGKEVGKTKKEERDRTKHERKWDRRRREMKVHVLSSLVLFHARQAGGEYHSLHPSGGGPRTHTGDPHGSRQWCFIAIYLILSKIISQIDVTVIEWTSHTIRLTMST